MGIRPVNVDDVTLALQANSFLVLGHAGMDLYAEKSARNPHGRGPAVRGASGGSAANVGGAVAAGRQGRAADAGLGRCGAANSCWPNWTVTRSAAPMSGPSDRGCAPRLPWSRRGPKTAVGDLSQRRGGFRAGCGRCRGGGRFPGFWRAGDHRHHAADDESSRHAAMAALSGAGGRRGDRDGCGLPGLLRRGIDRRAAGRLSGGGARLRCRDRQ